jgi:demethylmenaquinone methyltransferase / 2-methoxy-6-polyprenyl-1,4-benzoquinol methylase
VRVLTRADLGKKPRDVAAMFDDVAPRYDLTNALLSFGQDRGWRRATAAAVGARPGEVVLDLAAGTGTSSVALADGSGATVVACDFSLGMLHERNTHPAVHYVAGDGLRLPFADASFDAVTISFGLRNLHDTDAGLRELARVTKPGGRLVVCEFSRPAWRPFRHVYVEYVMRALPAIAKRVSSNPEAYVYLAESIRAWPNSRELAHRIAENGWTEVAWRNLTGGIVAVHRGRRPA